MRPAPRTPGRVWARSEGSSSRISTAVSTCGTADSGLGPGWKGILGVLGAASRGTDLGVGAQGHVVFAAVALVLPVEPDGVQESTGSRGLTSLQN